MSIHDYVWLYLENEEEEYVNAFWVGGAICAVCQVFIDKTKLTPARILVSLVVIGVFLPVSYTHLDVYKRQGQDWIGCSPAWSGTACVGSVHCISLVGPAHCVPGPEYARQRRSG